MSSRRNFLFLAALAGLCSAAGAAEAKAPLAEEDRPGTLRSTSFRSGGVELYVRLFVPEVSNPRAVLLLHGFPGSELNFDLAHSLRRLGFLVAIPHYRGSWGMQGKYSFAAVVEDAANCAAWLGSPEFAKEQGPISELSIIGHSLGGFAALMAGKSPNIARVASIAGFNFGEFAGSLKKAPAFFESTAQAWDESLLPLQGTSGHALATEVLEHADDWKLQSLSPHYRGRNVLLIGGANDKVSEPPVHHAPLVQAFRAGGVRLTEVTLNSDHSFASVRLELCRRVTRWLTSSS